MRPTGNLIRDLAEKYLRDKRGQVASYETLQFVWKAIAPAVGHLRPDQITREWCRDHAAKERAKGRADGTIRKQLGLLSAICRWSDRNSPAIIEMPPMPAPRERYLTRDEAARLIDATSGSAYQPHIKLFIILALCTGARMSAVLELTWGQIDFVRGEINLGKSVGNKGRARVPMNTSARRALEEAYEGRLTDEAVVEYAGGPVKSIKKGFSLACKRAGLEGVHPHVLRHTAAVWMAEAGVPMAEIAQYLGHSSPNVTYRTYARYSPTYLRGAAEALELEVRPRAVG